MVGNHVGCHDHSLTQQIQGVNLLKIHHVKTQVNTTGSLCEIIESPSFKSRWEECHESGLPLTVRCKINRKNFWGGFYMRWLFGSGSSIYFYRLRIERTHVVKNPYS